MRAHSRLILIALLICGTSTCNAQITVDSASARAVLRAVQDPQLTPDQAREVCGTNGNQGLVRKEHSYGRKATTQSCADALLAAAQGKAADQAFKFRFESIKPRAAELAALLDRIEENPVAFQQWVTTRVAQFSPPNSKVKISGYLLVGGVSGGFAFDEPEFYLNLAYFSDFDVARVVMAHELYHAVQGVYAPSEKGWWSVKDAGKGADRMLAQQCSTNYDYFGALYQEGTASYVGDPLLLSDVKSHAAQKMVKEMEDGIGQLVNSLTLLELSMTGLNAPDPVPFDQVYALGFYVPEIEYKLGYVMAKAIAADHGDSAITALLKQPPYAFINAYISLPKYGKDHAHPTLGPNTITAFRRLQAGCARPVAGQRSVPER